MRELLQTTRDGTVQTPTSEEIHFRNFDVERAYDLTVRVRDGPDIVFADRYYLTPGKTVAVREEVPPGEYEVVVELDGHRRERAVCAVGPTAEETALVEVGNGTVSVTEGHY